MARLDEKKCYQIVVLGGGGVGKSCLTFRLVHNDFIEKYDPTLEDSYRKNNFRVDGEICPIEILDTAGQDSFAPMRDLYYKNGDGFLLVFSITDLSSLEDVKARFEDLLSSRGVDKSSCPPLTVVGNKCDLEADRVVSSEAGRKVVEDMGENVRYIETSAKADINVEETFQEVVRRVKERDLASAAAIKTSRKKKRKCSLM